jgi:hypothetical protein
MGDLVTLAQNGVEFKHSVENETIYKIGALIVIVLVFNKLVERYL